jgi:AraC-like DNA-binding protein
VVASYRLGAADHFDWHEHGAHQLSVAADGVLCMGVDERDRMWVLPRSRALWIPAGRSHTVDTIGGATMTSLWFDPVACPIDWTEPTVVPVDELLGALVARLDRDDLGADERARAEAVLFDLVRPLALPTATLDLPMPVDDRARRVADALLADPADPRSLAEWGRVVGAGDRTLTRAFVRETGLRFDEWRTRARVTAAVGLLATGSPVGRVAGDVGYATASAFGAAFRRVTGTTPTAYFGA